MASGQFLQTRKIKDLSGIFLEKFFAAESSSA
jgi:hypothetical protein